MILINGKQVEPAADASIVEVEPGVFSVLANGASFEVRIGESTAAIRGHVVDFEVVDQRQWRRSGEAAGSQGRAAITAPMPGKVVRILVQAGEAVGAGQGILIVEAMKMQNELKSPRAGVVTRMAAKEGDSVTAGLVLAVIE